MLVVIVVFLFLGNVRATLIPLIAVPVSLIGTFAVMLALGYLRQHGLAAGAGAGDRHRGRRRHRRGRGGRGASSRRTRRSRPPRRRKRAMGQITAPIIAITLVLLSVFVPVAFIPGISGELFRQFAVAVSVSMVISAINALTLSPALCAVFLRAHHGPQARPDRLRAARHRQGARRLRRWSCARLVRLALFGLVVLLAVDGRRRLAVQGHADRLPAVGGPGRVLRRGAVARGRLGQPHRGGGQAGRGDRSQTRRASPASPRWSATACSTALTKSNSALLHRAAQAVRRAQGPGAGRERHHRAG